MELENTHCKISMFNVFQETEMQTVKEYKIEWIVLTKGF